ncbi:MAG TPA: hypothetical protein VF746_22830 [Longimicrobium sp.]|jgi:hypothetical protein
MNHAVRIRVLGILAAVAASAACSRPDPAPAAGEPVARIAEVRRQPLGSMVTVEGVVTVPSGVIDAGFAVQDATAGIYVAADSATRVEPFQVVRVSGRLADNHGLLGIAPDSVAVRGAGRPPQPRAARTGEVGEATEGSLLATGGTVAGPVVDDRPYGWKVTIDDGSGPLLVFVPVGAKMDVSGIRPGQRLRVVGFSGQYDDHHEILPRSQADLTVLGGP